MIKVIVLIDILYVLFFQGATWPSSRAVWGRAMWMGSGCRGPRGPPAPRRAWAGVRAEPGSARGRLVPGRSASGPTLSGRTVDRTHAPKVRVLS